MSRILVTGASGQLGNYLLREMSQQKLQVLGWSGSEQQDRFGIHLRQVDLGRPDEIRTAYRLDKPNVVVHLGGLCSIDACFQNPERARQVNLAGTACLAELSASSGARMIFSSTDLVFDGSEGSYLESALPSPLSVYGQTKALAERAVLTWQQHIVVRLSLLFGPSLCGRPNFFDRQMTALRAQTPCTLFADEWRTPLSLCCAARAIAALTSTEDRGIMHVGGPERMSRLEFGRRLASALGTSADCLVSTSRDAAAAPEPRARDVSLNCQKWRGQFPEIVWSDWDDAIAEML